MKVLANDGISKKAINYLKENGIKVLEKKIIQSELINFINKNFITILLVRSATEVRKELIDNCPSIKIIGRLGVGLDNIDTIYAKKKGIHVVNSLNASAKSVAELVFSHFFSISRNLHNFNREISFLNNLNFLKLKKKYNKGQELYGKTLGVIGCGKIGIETIKLGIKIGMKIVAYDLFINKSQIITLNFFDKQKIKFKLDLSPLDKVIKISDYISIHVPKQNKYLLDEKEFNLMKKDVIIVNTSRGGVINEDALINFLNFGKIRGAGLDVFENEPIVNPNILNNNKISFSPHIGGSTIEAQDRISCELAFKIVNYLSK